MLEDGPTWFLVADGRRARMLIEPRRGAQLEEPDDWVMEIGPEDTYDIQDRPPRSFERVGQGRHAMDGGRNLHEAEEEKFLKRVVSRIVDAEKRGAFTHLAIAAAPRALGLLRNYLPAGVRERLRAAIAQDIVSETPAALRKRLRDMLRPV
jgi:protein required for attachment to host cells